MLALSRADIRRVVPMAEAVELMKVAFAELSAGRAVAPVRASVDAGPGSMLLTMPGYVPAADALGVKVVSFFGNNAAKGVPTIHALVYMVDAETGAPLGILEGSYVTALRTGAVSGAATDLLARKDAKTLVVIGAGVQGVTQAAAVCAVRPIERIIVVDSRAESLPAYVDKFRADWPQYTAAIETSTDANAAVAQADVICTATTARTAVFADSAVKAGTHINAVGAFTPEMQEIPEETVLRATIVVDQVEACLHEAGDLIKPMKTGKLTQAQFSRELGQVAAGTAPGRVSDAEITFFKSVGNAVQDVIVGRRALDRAREQGVGQTINLL